MQDSHCDGTCSRLDKATSASGRVAQSSQLLVCSQGREALPVGRLADLVKQLQQVGQCCCHEPCLLPPSSCLCLSSCSVRPAVQSCCVLLSACIATL